MQNTPSKPSWLSPGLPVAFLVLFTFSMGLEAFATCPLTASSQSQGVANSQLESELTVQLASLLHDEWRASRWQAAEGRFEPREKTLDDGTVVDIANTDYPELPEKFQAENRDTAKIVIQQILGQVAQHKPLDAAFVESASSLVHDKWVERNASWAPPEQKLPFDQLTQAEADKDRVMVRKGIGIFRTRQADELVFKLASQLHEEWRAPRWQAAEGRFEPREKTLDDGTVVDIANTDYGQLPEKFKAENRDTARIVIELIIQRFDAGLPLNNAFIEAASSIVHDKWVERNASWAPPEQKLPFDQLTQVEADKDRVMVRKGTDIFAQY